ncbi:hypothetical protein Tsp_11299 [Trichinella spiralis]|uniref:hypothetical protein n=1 Tax=Trichinella spiralis TaxID=6334 RepID=UPI0001EFEF0D|nr:hypothetical protein Tsp_11299 [Trichinella spiralis]
MNSGTKWEQHCAEVGPSPRPLFTVPCANKKYRNHAGRRVLLLFCPTSHVSAFCCHSRNSFRRHPGRLVRTHARAHVYSSIPFVRDARALLFLNLRRTVAPVCGASVGRTTLWFSPARREEHRISNPLSLLNINRQGDPQWYGGRWAVT